MSSIRLLAKRTFAGLTASFYPSGASVANAPPAFSTPLSLARGQWVSRSRGGNTVVTCMRGHVWITQSGDPRDVLLAAGDSYACERDTYTIIQAIDRDAEILLIERMWR